jgi:hypothetical protein
MKYDHLLHLLTKCCFWLRTNENEELLLVQRFNSNQAWIWRLEQRGSTRNIKGKAVDELATELDRLNLPDTYIPLGINPDGTFRANVLVNYNYDPPRYRFKLTPLNPYEKLTKLDESFEAEDDQI